MTSLLAFSRWLFSQKVSIIKVWQCPKYACDWVSLVTPNRYIKTKKPYVHFIIKSIFDRKWMWDTHRGSYFHFLLKKNFYDKMDFRIFYFYETKYSWKCICLGIYFKCFTQFVLQFFKKLLPTLRFCIWTIAALDHLVALVLQGLTKSWEDYWCWTTTSNWVCYVL